MVSMLEELGNLVWIILPLAAIQIALMGVALWQWYKKKNYLGQNKLIWLLLIIFISSFGPIIFLLYSQRISESSDANKNEIDEWEV